MRIRVIPPKQDQAKRKLRVCAYTRVSSDSEELENSLENQTLHYEQLIQANPLWEFVKVYSDDGRSGFKASRPGFQEMLQDARQKKFDLILVKSISRFARNTQTLLSATRELKALGIAVYFELQDINTLTTAGELMLTVKGAFAQAESEVASETAKLTIRSKFANYKRTAASERTYGFYADSNGDFRINEDEARVVKRIFELAHQGVWASKIKNYLNNENIPAPMGGKWDDCGIARVLRNEMYKGDLVLQKTVKDANRVSRPNRGEADQWYLKGDHEPIVDPALWDEVQEVLTERRRHLDTPLPPPPVEHRSSHSRYPLTGLLFCPYCGEKLLHKWGNRNREYWACRTNIKVSAAACKGVWIPAQVADGWGITEPVVVVPYEDKFGMAHFTAFPKDEYKAFSQQA